MSPDLVPSHLLALANTPVELVSEVDALYLSAHGDTPSLLLDDLEALRSSAEATDLPADASLGGYAVKVLARA